MKDRYKLDLFYPEVLNAQHYVKAQEISDSVLSVTELFISILPMDYPIEISVKHRKDIENQWLNILPTLNSVRTLSIRHKVNQKFFESICKMKNLEKLFIWSSSASDISSISKLQKLTHLSLDSFNKLYDISPTLTLEKLELLSISNCFSIKNYYLLGQMHHLIGLKLSGDMFAPKNLKIPSLKQLSDLKKLKHLDLTITSVVDNSYSEILKFDSLERFDTVAIIPKPIRDMIKQNHKNLKAGFFTDWDYQNKKFYPNKEW